jgi:two-component system cell cycle sensor histidine kinase/response regulator CckA
VTIQPLKVLLVEDDESHCDLIRRAFEEADPAVRLLVAGTVDRARGLLSSGTEPPDVMVTDWRLPDGEGLELLRAPGCAAGIPVIVMTSHGNERVAVEAVKAGALDYVVKSEETLLDMPHIVERALREWTTLQEKVAIQRRLHETEHRIRIALSRVPVVLLAADGEGRLMVAEGNGLSSLAPDGPPALGLPVEEALGACPEAAVSMRRALAGEVHSAVLESGNVAFDAWFSPLQDDAGRARGTVAVAIDVSSQRRAEKDKARLEEQLFQAQKMESLGRLAGGIAHDFNNLLTVIAGNADLALRAQEPGCRTAILLEEITAAARTGSSMTQQLLAFARKQVLEPSLLDVSHVLDAQRWMLTRLLGGSVDLRLDLSASAGPVFADRSQLEQIVLNLVLNARDAMPKGGILAVRTVGVTIGDGVAGQHRDVPPGRYVVLSVADTGTGMSEDVRQRVFEPFFTTKARGRGTGLGLAVTYGTVAQLGGSIHVDSAPDRGTMVTVYLPVAERGAAVPSAEGPRADALQGGRETILLVEDEPTVLSFTTLALEELGYTVLPHGDPVRALEAAKAHEARIDLLLTDVMMPGMNGAELAMELVGRFPSIKVLYPSGYTEDVVLAEGRPTREVEFVQKPYTLSVLAERIRKMLDGPSPQ